MSTRGRPSQINDPEYAKAIAEAYVSGMNQQEMADEFSVGKGTISKWIKDPRVMVHAGHFVRERVARITRRIDNEIEHRLDDVEEIDIELLLKIRKEFLSNTLVEIDKSDTGAATADAVGVLEENPDLARLMQELAKGDKA